MVRFFGQNWHNLLPSAVFPAGGGRGDLASYTFCHQLLQALGT